MYENEDDGLALDLTPFVNAANAGVDTYARVKAANANAAAIKNASRQPVQQMSAPARKRSPLSYLLMIAAVGGIGYLGYKMVFKRRGRR